MIYLKGGDDDKIHYDIVLNFDTGSHQWSQVGKMMVNRSSHAVSVVNTEDTLDICVKPT